MVNKVDKIRLDQLLVQKGWVESRQKAQAEILAGNVLIKDVVMTKAGIRFLPDVEIRLKSKFPYVSRGALKLLHALSEFKADPTGKVCIDVGSSTGGFTEVLLERGAKQVYAVDVGTNQLSWKIRQDSRVVVMEKTNARNLTADLFAPPPELAVIDVSFISLTRILKPICNLMQNPEIIALIKPQFELDPSLIGHNGLVDPKNRPLAIQKVLDHTASIHLTASKVIESPITGAKSGNVEYLIHLSKDQ